MEIKVKTISKLGVITTIISSENFFYLLDVEKIKIMGLLTIQDFFIFLGLLWMFFVMYKYRKYPSPKYRFKWIILFTIILMIFSSIQANINYHQSLILGIRPQRFWVIWAFMYFPIGKLLHLKVLKYEEIEKYIFIIGTIELILYIAQYFLQNYITFLYVGSNNTYTNVRFYVNNIFLNLLLFINLNRVFNRKKIIKSIVYIILIMFVIIIVGKMRMTFIATISAIMIGILLWKNGKEIRIFTIVICIILGFMMSKTEEIKSIFMTLQGKSSVNTLEVRDIGREFYIDTVKENPFLGGGYINTQWEQSKIAARVNEGIYWVDNGIFGFAYFYGCIGIVWVIVLFYKIFKMGWVIQKKYKCYIFFIMPIYWIVAMITELHWYYNSFFVMTLLICMLEDKFIEFKKL